MAIDNIQYLLEKKKRSLFYYSETIKEYPAIYSFIMECKDDVTEEKVVEKLTENDIKTIEHLIPRIYQDCQNEWKHDENASYPEIVLEGDERIPCSICNTPTKNIYYIKNKLNGQKLNVGSICIDYFLVDDMMQGKSKSQLIKESRKTQRLSILNYRYPGIGDNIEQWNNRLDSFNIIIPSQIATYYQDLGNVVRTNYSHYLDGKNISPDIFKAALEQQEQFMEKMENYVVENEKKPFVATRRMANWLKSKNDFKTIEKLSDTGFVTSDVISKLTEHQFALSLIPIINIELKNNMEMIATSVDEDNNAFLFKPNGTEVYLSMNCSKFLESFGGVLFGESPKHAFIIYNLFKLSKVYNDSSRFIVLQNLKIVAKDVGLTLRFDGMYDYFQNNEIDIYHRKTDRIYVANLRNFTDEFKYLSFKIGDKPSTELLKFFNRPEYKKLSSKELKELRQSSIEMSRRYN